MKFFTYSFKKSRPYVISVQTLEHIFHFYQVLIDTVVRTVVYKLEIVNNQTYIGCLHMIWTFYSLLRSKSVIWSL
jgi:hypothetical protein